MNFFECQYFAWFSHIADIIFVVSNLNHIMKKTLTTLMNQRLADLTALANHNGRDHWHGLRCFHFDRGQFSATYSDLALRWKVSQSAAYRTIKKFIDLGYIKVGKLPHATLITVLNCKENNTTAIKQIESNQSVTKKNNSRKPLPVKQRIVYRRKSKQLRLLFGKHKKRGCLTMAKNSLKVNVYSDSG